MSFFDWLLIAYAVMAGLYWTWLAVGAWLVVRRIPRLAEDASSPPTPWPKVSILVPAANEEESVEAAGRALLAQDYPDFEVVLVDDRSRDATGQIMDRLAAGDSRAKVVHVTDLPEDWLGKVHALARGLDAAEGEWLLFTDADVHLRPDAVRRAVAHAEANGLYHLALTPDLWSSGRLLLDILISTFLRTFLPTIRAWRIADPKSRAFGGVGAFNLVRRRALEKTPGLQWLRLEVADDVGLGMMIKRVGGGRSAMLDGTGVIGLYWYRTLAELARGTEKGFASVGRCSVARMVGVTVAIVLLEGSPLVLLGPWGVPGLPAAGLVMIALACFSVVTTSRRFRRRILPGLLWPVGIPVAAWLLLRSAWLGWIRGGVLWRDTLYPSRKLRAGARVRFP